ncbi:MAG: precorrin-8X methylmutase [Dissulfurispiraceae bacterium]
MEHIILIGHGSPKKEANNIQLVGKLLHNALHPGCNKGCVKVAYLQFARPDIMQTIKECVVDGTQRITIHPYFLTSGVHVTKDIPKMIKEAGERYPTVEFIYTEPLGVHKKLVEIVREKISSACPLTPREIEKRSFEIISEELNLSDVPADQLPIVNRVIHATADFEFKDSLLFHPDAIQAGLRAIVSGKDILTDVEMVKTGINKRLLEKWSGKVSCNIQRVEDIDLGKENTKNKTRAESGIELGLKEGGNIGIIAVGNAPTALLRVIEMLNAAECSLSEPILVVGVPVGFVKAFESKVLLAEQRFPFITNLSRKGGTPVAVAIVNALLRMAGEM